MSIDPMTPPVPPVQESFQETTQPVLAPDPTPDPVPARREPRRGLGFFSTVLVAGITALVVGLVAGLSGYLIGQAVDDGTVVSETVVSAAVVPLVQSGGDSSPRSDQSIAGIVSAVLPSVVSILVEGEADNYYYNARSTDTRDENAK